MVKYKQKDTWQNTNKKIHCKIQTKRYMAKIQTNKKIHGKNTNKKIHGKIQTKRYRQNTNKKIII